MLVSREKQSESFFSFTAPAYHSFTKEVEGRHSEIRSIANIPGTNFFVTIAEQDWDRMLMRYDKDRKHTRGEIIFWLCEDNQFKPYCRYQTSCNHAILVFVDINNNLVICGLREDNRSMLECWDLSAGIDKATCKGVRVFEHSGANTAWSGLNNSLVSLSNGDLIFSNNNSTQIFCLKAGEQKSHKIELKSFFESPIRSLFLLPENRLLVIAKQKFPKIPKDDVKKLTEHEQQERIKIATEERIFYLNLNELLKSCSCDESMISNEIFLCDLGINSFDRAIMLRSGEIALIDGEKVFLFDPMNLLPGSARELCDLQGDLVDSLAETTDGRLLFVKNPSGSVSSISLSRKDDRLVNETIQKQLKMQLDGSLISLPTPLKKIVEGYCDYYGLYQPVHRSPVLKQEQNKDVQSGYKLG